MIRVQEHELEKLKEHEQTVNEIKEQSSNRERTNYLLSHVMIVGGLVVTILSNL